ncbi:hypothetical protein H4O09_10125 [Stenotrophomonas sp. W1S232]|uniref:Uncharacterized protein n=1 Tax=Stenotrophomonas koreensis TaxID=266128 RepID=A0A7W3V0U7_9GAMM|nr:hypothetical protein [Stenotrophomonas koreensis]MBB1117404.1 hypothetical protein [Stenotrophomonas koreensis]
MTDDPRVKALLEWNRLARENAENAIVSSMLSATSKSSEPIETFTTWLLVGAAAIASFLLGNADKLIPILGQSGFRSVGAALCVSCLFGLLSKVFALRHKVAVETGKAVEQTFEEHLARHEKEELQIQESAAVWGITLDSGIRMERVLKEFLAPMPWWVRWTAQRYLKKHGNNPQVGHISRIKSLTLQGTFAFLQAISFLTFLGIGFHAAAI